MPSSTISRYLPIADTSTLEIAQHRIILRSATICWISVFANAAFGLLLTPRILHSLGDEAFGIWVLTTTLVFYSGVLDIGLRASVVRFLSYQKALGNEPAANEVIATAFYFYACVSLLIMLATLVLAPRLPVFFYVHRDLVSPFRHLFILAGLIQAVTFSLEVFVGTVQAAARFDRVYTLRVISLGLRVLLVLAALHVGGGLFAIGACVVVPDLLFYCAHVPIALRVMPNMSLHPKWCRKSVLHDMLGYGSVSFTVAIAQRLRDNVYPAIIAKVLTAPAVTLFALPIKLIAFPVQGIGTMTEVINPLSSQLEARDDFSSLRRLIQLTVQSAFLILVPMAVFLLVFGRDVLSWWAGAQYVSSYPLLAPLTLGMGVAATQCSVQSMLFGIARHKELAWFRMAEGLIITVLGIAVLRGSGLLGLAWLTAITLLVTNLLMIPRHLCRNLDLGLSTYLKEACLKPCLLAIPLATALVAVHSFMVIDGWLSLAMALLITLSVFGLILLFLIVSSPPADSWLSLEALRAIQARLIQFRKLKPLASLGTEQA